MATFHFDKALTSYTQAFCLQKDDHSLMDAMKKAGRELKKDQRAEKQIPWIGAGVGIIIGVVIVLADYGLASKPVLGVRDIHRKQIFFKIYSKCIIESISQNACYHCCLSSGIWVLQRIQMVCSWAERFPTSASSRSFRR